MKWVSSIIIYVIEHTHMRKPHTHPKTHVNKYMYNKTHTSEFLMIEEGCGVKRGHKHGRDKK